MLALTNGFIMVDALTASDAFENSRLLVVAVWWNQNQEGLADDLFRNDVNHLERNPTTQGENADTIGLQVGIPIDCRHRFLDRGYAEGLIVRGDVDLNVEREW